MSARERLLRGAMLTLPWWSRGRIGDEVLSTLADAADDGRRRTLREAASVVALGLRFRLARDVSPTPTRVVRPLVVGGFLLLGATLLPGIWWAVHLTPHGTFVAGPGQLSRGVLLTTALVAILAGSCGRRGVRPHPWFVAILTGVVVVAAHLALRAVTAWRFDMDLAVIIGGAPLDTVWVAGCCALGVVVTRLHPRVVAFGAAAVAGSVVGQVFLLYGHPAPRLGVAVAGTAVAVLVCAVFAPGRRLGDAYRARATRGRPPT